jgi:periplasmic divalent cation tolerance protein
VTSPGYSIRLAKAFVQSGTVACAQVDGPVESYYQWEGQLESAREWRIWVKYAAAKEAALQTMLTAEHPYDVPQWVSVGVSSALPAYAAWVCGSEETQAND